ncbi:hypothetical protein [Brevundimonas subvibrioides]|uniref:Uncharacterized protein n=1 Tax=Brevundimonas subvibrioides (strain ATCC 15264 / DSM 4735 / LMG 14903 / NBRC 16000 / CB 81) TaxID=633149 RepID=D9QFX4_BRESC|nr:hypothetical protein [Brevundimonas subvibrioides]ADL00688.1 hypothetical protein Bresu_1376 [Brevundimonas subvibrioides ATCC 15264]
MSARNAPRQGWVTVVAAAAALTEAGDRIDASNVSRYLARNPDIGQEKVGKFRYVDLVALKAHRNTSLYVADKRQARDLDAPEHVPLGRAVVQMADLEEDAPVSGGSAIANANLELKQIELRKRLREEALETGALVHAEEVRTICTGMLEAYAAELARQEGQLTAKLGREIGMQIRKAHRAARMAAVNRMIEAAGQQMDPGPSVDEDVQAA